MSHTGQELDLEGPAPEPMILPTSTPCQILPMMIVFRTCASVEFQTDEIFSEVLFGYQSHYSFNHIAIEHSNQKFPLNCNA